MSPSLSRLAASPVFRPALVLLALTASVYWPVAGFGFLNWDDSWYVLDNPLVKSWSPANLLAICTEPCSKNFAPLTIFVLLIEHTLFGGWAGGYHLVHALLHGVNAVLAFRLVEQVTGRRWTAWGAAALFVVHPVQIETAAWISSLKSLLAAGFMFASLRHWLRLDRTPQDEARGLGLLVLALLSKASAVVTPAIVLSFDVLLRRKRFKEALIAQVLPGLFCLMALFLNMHAQNQLWGGTREHYDWGLLKILAVDSVLVWRYLRMLLLPWDLSVMYDVPGTGVFGPAVLATLAWAACGAAVWRVRRTQPMLVWSILSWFLLLFPVLNIFPITTLMNDRYLYVPSLLVFAGALQGLEVFIERLWARGAAEGGYVPGMAAAATRTRTAVLAAAALLGLLVGGYAEAARRLLPVWRDPESLWSHAMLQAPGLPVVQIQWALTLHARGEVSDAAHVLDRLLESDRPDPGDRRRVERLLREWRPAAESSATGSQQPLATPPHQTAVVGA